ncbi:MAG TPA: tetratricopeptide repeat protein [Caulobacteraceae bacterium]|nr:tetratricopeptide repeat protein [Caulobacteraceae bacterium]
MAHRRLQTFAAGLLLAALASGAVQAQTGADRRLDRVERDLKTLQSIVLQAQATGQPVVVRPEGADPAVTALASKVDDLEQTLQRINGQVETLGHDLDQARRADQAAQAEQRVQDKLLADRLTRIETQLSSLTQAATAADPGLADAGASADTASNPRRLGGAADATGRAQAQDAGVLGGRGPPPPPPPPPPQGPNETFAAARALFADGQNGGAADAFQDFISRYPTNARTPEAYYWLGESYYAQKGYQNATAAYASALRNRPTTAWAPAAMVRLSQALVQSNQTAQACAALSEFDQRYAARASAAVKTNAEAVRRRARCS